MRIGQLFTWRNACLALTIAIAFYMTGRVSYDLAYVRGEKDAREAITLDFIHNQKAFLDEIRLNCQSQVYTLMTKTAIDKTNGKMWEATGHLCRDWMNEAILELSSAR